MAIPTRQEEDILAIFEKLGLSSEEEPQKTLEEETKEALRRHTAEKIEKAYASAVQAVGSELEFSSARHLAVGLFGLLSDATYTLWDPIRQVLRSPVMTELIENEVGEGKTIGDLFDRLTTEDKKSKSERAKKEKENKNLFKDIERSEAYFQAIAAYAQEKGISPDDVLQSKKDMLGIIVRVYGSLEQYETIQGGVVRSIVSQVEKLDQLQHLPFGILIQKGAEALGDRYDIGLEDLTDMGVDLTALSGIAKKYVGDIAIFGKAFLTEIAKQTATAIQEYRALAEIE